MFKKILLATDGSEHSLRSAEHAIKLAIQFNGTVDVVYVVDARTSKSDVLHYVDKYEVKRERQEKIKPVLTLLESSEIDYKVQILHGEPGPSIVDYANKHDFNCVVVGSRGLNNLQTMVLGSVSHKLAKRVKCPVLITK
ncbi:universal stress protein [Aquibacillus halophilus]|uniref:Universal stress protein n=1 Tax=Aquibacillus halophilus TaxID=930132 RepID=A0A6A8DTH5_9BACI|nr:universal stress protein [Aquibacillus halophilus]MRH44532.1 universal stress protein [Aquibacillus halophilus]